MPGGGRVRPLVAEPARFSTRITRVLPRAYPYPRPKAVFRHIPSPLVGGITVEIRIFQRPDAWQPSELAGGASHVVKQAPTTAYRTPQGDVIDWTVSGCKQAGLGMDDRRSQCRIAVGVVARLLGWVKADLLSGCSAQFEPGLSVSQDRQ